MEWDEEGRPCSVVNKKHVKGLSEGSGIEVGDVCSVGIRQRGKQMYFNARLLGIGELSVCNVVCIIVSVCMFVYATGSKLETENKLEEMDGSSSEVTDDNIVSPEIACQGRQCVDLDSDVEDGDDVRQQSKRGRKQITHKRDDESSDASEGTDGNQAKRIKRQGVCEFVYKIIVVYFFLYCLN